MIQFNKIVRVRHCLALFLLFLVGCDFSSRLKKEIVEAQQLIHHQQYKKAARKYEELLTLNPPEEVKIKVYYQLGELYYLHLDNKARARDKFIKIKEESMNPLWKIKAVDKLAELEFKEFKNYRESIKHYQDLANYLPALEKQEFYQLRLGQSFRLQSQFVSATKIFTEVIRNENHSFYNDAHFELALVYYDQQQWKEAINHFKRHIQIETRKNKVVESKFFLANTLETIENLKEAYEVYYSILGEFPNTEVIKKRLETLYQRRIARKR